MSHAQHPHIPPTTPPPIPLQVALDHLFTAIYAAEAAGVVGTLLWAAPPVGCTLSPAQLVAALAGGCAGWVAVFQAVRAGSSWAGRLLSRTLLAGDPLSKPVLRHKFQDQSWQLVAHASMSALEACILFSAGTTWMRDYTSLWIPPPWEQPNGSEVHALYGLQMSIWLVTCYFHRFVQERNKDYFTVYLHHLATIGLVWFSWWFNYVRIGTVVLFLHDVSDIFIDLLKLCNYCKLEGPKGLFLVEGCFAATLLAWPPLRGYLFGVHVLFRGAIYGAREVGFHSSVLPAAASLALGGGKSSLGANVTGHVRGGQIGDGSFDLLTNLRNFPVIPSSAFPNAYWSCVSLLATILVMNVFWYYALLRILIKILRGADPHEAGADEYEGADEDEGDEGDGGSGGKEKES